MKVEMTEAMADALYKRMMKPEKDREGNPVYVVDIELARELRIVLGAAGAK